MDWDWWGMDEELVERTAMENPLCRCLRAVIGIVVFMMFSRKAIGIKHLGRWSWLEGTG